MFSLNLFSLRLLLLSAILLMLSVVSPKARGEGVKNKGQALYVTYCAACHGLKGDGQGEYASSLQIKPRDFTKGLYKFKSTPSGSSPLDEDLIRNIRRGIPGTAMTPQDYLSDEDLRELISYIKFFSPRLGQTKLGKPIVIPPALPFSSDQIHQGKLVYQKSQCIQCHGLEGKGDGLLAKDLTIKPADLTKRPFKSGPTPQDLVRTILTGIDGTSMPPYQFILNDKDIWSIAYYINSLGKKSQENNEEKLGREIMKEILSTLDKAPHILRDE